MKLKNTGAFRIRLDRNKYIAVDQVIEVSSAVGKSLLIHHSDLIDVTPKKKRYITPKSTPEPKIHEVNLDGIE